MSEYKLIYEEFDNINEMLLTLNSRVNNKVMSDQNSSRKKSDDWSGTKSYEDAENLIRNGYVHVLDKIKAAVHKNSKYIYEHNKILRQRKNMPVGFVPHIPNAIRNLPDSMVNIISHPVKEKTMTIVYCMSGSCSENVEHFIDAGAALVTAINLIELSGIQTRLLVNFMPAKSGDELVSPTLCIKNFGERFNLTKICFPLINPAMFRRFGFKWLETTPNIKERSFSFGYGSVPSIELLRENLSPLFRNNVYIINTKEIERLEYDAKEILKDMQEVSNVG